MTKDEALQMCLEYIETDAHERKYVRHAIKAALAQPQQEPVKCLDCGSHNVGLPANYDSLLDSVKAQPAQEREWVGLTDEEREGIAKDYSLIGYKSPFKEIEAKLKEKNT
jgi:hypothetical protein